ncbi:alpha/beta fold hydrolase [Acidisphaera rubrifaciens]|uniref:Haloalkane dehalogenase n=1 Tax=Acidisphaera rubrifaciens HS-AP3 TaxID=1231350 RepID=A0A0D6P496_9PROT|nr:alpha/beta fold hydrolase [Acidisphaera rubrifaciens]GAN76492.1 haloalkane dehalogenase [Acidisphaera rubrifaciens HS-AP3]
MIQDDLARTEGFRTRWPHAARYARVNGWRMHYVDEGHGDPVLLLHGNPTWGFLYRDVIPPLLQAGYRVIVPDMIGFGLSEKPPREQAHSLDGHIANLTGLVRQLDLRRLAVVCHDWGGPTGLSFAMNNPDRVRALTVMSTWAWAAPPAEFHTRVFPWRTMHAPLVGPYLLGRHNVLAGRGVYLSVVDREKFRREAQPVYEAVLPDPAARLLTWTWPRWIPLDAEARAARRFAWLEERLARSALPTLIVWGREDDVFDAATFAARFKRLLPHADGPHLVTGRHFLQEDSGAAIGALIAAFLGRLDGGGAVR